MAEGKDLEDVKDIASKAVSQTCKLALVLHIAENPEVLDEKHSEISAETWVGARQDWAVRCQVRRVERLA
jgi:hypothetical protein